MKSIRILLAVVSLLVMAVLPARVSADNGVEDFNPQVILVKFKPGVGPAAAAQVHRQHGGQLQGVIPGIGVQRVAVPAGKALEKAKGYAASPAVAYAEPDYVGQAANTPDDAYYGQQWGMGKVGAPQAWDVTTGSGSVNVAILDTGVDLDHPDLAGKLTGSINFSNSPTVDDVYGHGTHVAGITAAGTNNGIGVAGLGRDATLMNVKVLNDSGSGYYSWITAGIIWAADNEAEVINLSLGGMSSSLALEDAVNYAWSKGVVIVAAAGNSGISSPFYPAYYENCIAIAATDVDDVKASWSNYGDWVDAAAPGVGIYSTLINNGYGYKSGTSMASPHAAGLAALVFTTAADTNGDGRLNDEVRAMIETTCDDIGLAGIGHGRINAAAAVGSEPVIPGSIIGIVTDAADGSALPGATVTAAARTALTGADGRYTLSDVSPGSYTVAAAKDGYEGAAQTVTVLSGAAAVADFSLNQAVVNGAVLGYVTDASDGSALAGATVSIGIAVALADADGRYSFADVPPGSYELTASKDGYDAAARSVTVAAGVTSVVNIALQPVTLPGSITGIVTDAADGSALAGATVTAAARTALTGADGRYTLSDVSPGSYTVAAAKDGYEGAAQTVTVLSGAAAVADFALVAEAPAENPMWVDSIGFTKRGKNLFISVHVSGESGAVAGAVVGLALACDSGGTWNFNGVTDASGTVSFKLGKAPAGAYLATISSLTGNGIVWDSTRGITSAGYNLP